MRPMSFAERALRSHSEIPNRNICNDSQIQRSSAAAHLATQDSICRTSFQLSLYSSLAAHLSVALLRQNRRSTEIRRPLSIPSQPQDRVNLTCNANRRGRHNENRERVGGNPDAIHMCGLSPLVRTAG